MIPGNRRVAPQPGLRLHIRRDVGNAIDAVVRACQQRMTTAGRLGQTARKRKKLRRRRLLLDVLSDVRAGVLSVLERNYRRVVEVAHGLPCGTRNRAEGASGHRRYRDVRYRRFRLVVELDGQAAHPAHDRDRDDVRDDELVETEGTATLRYGWPAVAGRPCATAGQVARMLRQGGWTGAPKACGPGCPIANLVVST